MSDTSPSPTCSWSSRSSPNRADRTRPGRGRPARSTSTFLPDVQGLAREGGVRVEKRPDTVKPGAEPHQFRLLSGRPARLRLAEVGEAGEKSEFRVHSVEPYKLSLWRYGLAKERAATLDGSTSTAPAPRCRSRPTATTPGPASSGTSRDTRTPTTSSSSTAPERSGLYYFHAETARGDVFRSLDRRPGAAHAPGRRAGLEHDLERLQQLRRPEQLHQPGQAAPHAHRQRPARTARYTDPDSITYDTEDYAPLSFDRPEPINHIDPAEQITDPIEGRAACHLASAEWRLLGLDGTRGIRLRLLRRNPAPLRRARPRRLPRAGHQHASRVLVLADVRRSRRGSSSGAAGSFTLAATGSTARSWCPRTARCYVQERRRARGRASAARKPVRHAGESEASLLGVVFTDTGIMTAAPYRVTDAGHWVFEGRAWRTATFSAIKPPHAMSRRRFGPRDRQGLRQLADKRAGPSPRE